MGRNLFDHFLFAGINPFHRETFCRSQFSLHFFDSFSVIICQDNLFHPRLILCDARDRFSHPTGSN